MGLTIVLLPAAALLLVLALILLVQGLRQKRTGKLLSAAGIFAVLSAGSAVMMEFITRPL